MKEVWSGQDQTSFVLALPIFPGRHQPSIVGASELNCRVRNGNGWTLTAISTNCFILTAFAAKINYLISLIITSLKRLVTRRRVELLFAA